MAPSDAAPKLSAVLSTVIVGADPFCRTVNVCPAIVIEPVRYGPALALTLKATGLGPLLVAPAVTVMNPGSLLTAAH